MTLVGFDIDDCSSGREPQNNRKLSSVATKVETSPQATCYKEGEQR